MKDLHKWPATSEPPVTHIKCLECGALKHLHRYIGNDGMVRINILEPKPPVTCP